MVRHVCDFEEKSVFAVLALCICSFGLYVIYRLWQLTHVINRKIENPISRAFTATAICIHVLSLLGILCYFLFPAPPALLLTAKLLHLLSSLFHVVWIIKVRNRLNTINNNKKGDVLWLNALLSSFFHVIYFQYKINQTVDSGRKKKLEA
ncbi:hypothetical protein [Alteromonas portus]|uniref:hypothetical protein n=1 Tax=Alteromonas portus TaxID=2565549 RepID=UPI003BF86982